MGRGVGDALGSVDGVSPASGDGEAASGDGEPASGEGEDEGLGASDGSTKLVALALGLVPGARDAVGSLVALMVRGLSITTVEEGAAGHPTDTSVVTPNKPLNRVNRPYITTASPQTKPSTLHIPI